MSAYRGHANQDAAIEASRRRWAPINGALDALGLDWETRNRLDNIVAALVWDERADALDHLVIGFRRSESSELEQERRLLA